MAWDGGLLSTGVCPGPAIAFAYSSGTVAAGEYEYVMEGEKLWRNRANGPMPPRKPKNVGARPRLKLSRFPCCTKRPPVNEFRTANGPGPVFAIPTLGLSFQLERNMIGRPIAVLQSTEVLKPPRRYWVTVIDSLGSGVSGLGAGHEEWGEGRVEPDLVGEGEIRRPGEPARDVELLGTQGQRGQLHGAASIRDALVAVAADVQIAPAVPLGEARLAGDLLGRGDGVDGIPQHDGRVGAVGDVGVHAGGDVEVLHVLKGDRFGGAPVRFRLHAVLEPAGHEPVTDLVLGADAVPEVAVAVPVELDLRVEVVVRRPVVSDVGDLPVVGGGRPHDVAEPELGDQDSRMPALLRVLEEERNPRHRHVADVEDRRAGDQHGLGDPLHLPGREVIVRYRQIAAGELRRSAVQPGAVRVHREVAPDEPVA